MYNDRMTRKNVKLVLSFDGAFFSGWQRQKNAVSVQQTIEDALGAILQKPLAVTGCGRTDAGVHAIAYVCNFRALTDLPPLDIRNALNAHLPESIRIHRAQIARPEFHARYDARSKIYRYLVSSSRSPFLKNRAFCVPGKLDLADMKRAAQCLIGEHDFSSFQAAGSHVRTTVRRMLNISIRTEKCSLAPSLRLTTIEMESTGFLYRMARNIVGLLLSVAGGKTSASSIPGILHCADRTKAPPTAPPQGLYLKEVRYDGAKTGKPCPPDIS